MDEPGCGSVIKWTRPDQCGTVRDVGFQWATASHGARGSEALVGRMESVSDLVQEGLRR